MSVLAAAVLLAAAPVSAADRTALNAATEAVFAPYRTEADSEAAWDRDIWSAEVRALVARWKAVMPRTNPMR